MSERLGTVFVELDLDATQFDRSQRTILEGARDTTMKVEKAYRILGEQQDYIFDAIAQRATNAYRSIAANAKSSAEEMSRAMKAKLLQISESEMKFKGFVSEATLSAQKRAVDEFYSLIKARAGHTATDLVNIEAARVKEIKALDEQLLGAERAINEQRNKANADYWLGVREREMKMNSIHAQALEENAKRDKAYLDKLKSMASERAQSIQNAVNANKSDWSLLGAGRSSQIIKSEMAQVEAAYLRQKQLAYGNAEDLMSLERAKNAKMLALNKELHAEKLALMKAETTAAKASSDEQIAFAEKAQSSSALSINGITRDILRAYATLYVLQSAGSALAAPFVKGFQAAETYRQSIASMAAMVMTFSEKAADQGPAGQWQKALAYSKEMIPVLEQIAAKTLLSGEETTALANAFARSGVFLDVNNKKQLESFSRISNALPLMTQGQEIMRQINTEIRSTMTGANEQSSMLLLSLEAIDPQIKEHLKTWRAQGTAMEHIGELLAGFGPATSLLENTWRAVKTTIDTTANQVLRGAMEPIYERILSDTRMINDYLIAHERIISEELKVAWLDIANIVGSIGGVIAGFGPALHDLASLTGTIVTGWGLIFAALKPIGQLIGDVVKYTYEWLKMIGQGATALGLLATGQFKMAAQMWEEIKKTNQAISGTRLDAWEILTHRVADNMGEYALQVEKAADAQKKLTNGASDNAPKTTASGMLKKEILEVNAELLKMQSNTRDGAIKNMESTIAQRREQFIKEKHTAEESAAFETQLAAYAAAQKQLIDLKYHDNSKKLAKVRLDQANDYYQRDLTLAKDHAQEMQIAGQDEMRTIQTEYNERLAALNKWRNAEKSQIKDSVTDLVERTEKLKAVDSEYAKRKVAFEYEKAKAEKEARQKSIQLEAELNKSVNQYSNESMNAELKALNERYNAYSRFAVSVVLLNQWMAGEIDKIFSAPDMRKLQNKLNYEEAINPDSRARLNAQKELLSSQYDLEKRKPENADRQDELTRELNAKLLRMDENFSQKRIQTAAGMWKDIGGYSKEEYDFEIELMRLQQKRYAEMTEDEVLASKWAAKEKERIDQKWALEHGDLMDGIKVGYQRMMDEQETWAKVGLKTFNEFANSASSALSQGLFDAFTGQAKKFSDYWQDFVKSIEKAFLDAVAQMIVQWIMLQTVMGFSGLLGIGAGASSGNAAGGMAGTNTTLGSTNLTSTMADGGVINEMVVGVGKSGRQYILGEGNEPEYVIPQHKMSGSSAKVSNNLTIQAPITINGKGASKRQQAELQRNIERTVQDTVKGWM